MMYEENIVIKKHLQKKPEENREALQQRFVKIRSFHEDPITAAILATSYYGMEELIMRLPRLNDILRNPFSDEEILHAITGLIIAADGGPAEGAKSIQITMALQRMGLSVKNAEMAHMVALLAISCKQVGTMMAQLEENMEEMDQNSFIQAGKAWIIQEQKMQEAQADETDIAYALLVGMKEEVETIFDEEF